MQIKLNTTNQNKWFHNTLVFLAPLGILYTTTVIGVINANEGAFSLEAFIPNQFVLGGMALYLLNAVSDYLRKLRKQ